MNRERDEPRNRHRARPSPAGREVLGELERSSEAFEPPPEEVLARIDLLPPSERKEIVAVLEAMALDMSERQRENKQRAALAASAAEIVQEAQERERAAGRPVDPDTTLGDALEILGR